MRTTREEILAQVRAEAESILRTHPGASLEQLNALLAGRMQGYNRAPQAEMGGLSPYQMRRLLDDRWDGEGVVKIATPANERVAGVTLVSNARTLLGFLEGGVKLTAAGNLPRAAVAAICETFLLPPRYLEHHWSVSKVLNELDVWPLHELRVVLELAKLATKRRGVLKASGRARRLLAGGDDGRLWELLFRTIFRELNLAYLSAWGPELPELQQGISYVLYRFGGADRRFRSPAELAARVLPPFVQDRLPPDSDFPIDWAASLLEARVLRPLAQLGLADTHDVPGYFPDLPDQHYRKSALFDRVLTFSFA